MSFKFPNYQRIKQEEDFKKLIKNAKKIKNRFFFYFLKNDYDFHRFAVSVNRKIGNAVQRNFIKRKMREFFRLNQHLVTEKHDLWIVAKGRFERKETREVEELFIQSMKKINSFNCLKKDKW